MNRNAFISEKPLPSEPIPDVIEVGDVVKWATRQHDNDEEYELFLVTGIRAYRDGNPLHGGLRREVGIGDRWMSEDQLKIVRKWK